MPKKTKSQSSDSARARYSSTSVPSKVKKDDDVEQPREPEIKLVVKDTGKEKKKKKIIVPKEKSNELEKYFKENRKVANMMSNLIDKPVGSGNNSFRPYFNITEEQDNAALEIVKKRFSETEIQGNLAAEDRLTALNVNYLALQKLGFHTSDIEISINRCNYPEEFENLLDWLFINLDKERVPKSLIDTIIKTKHDGFVKGRQENASEEHIESVVQPNKPIDIHEDSEIISEETNQSEIQTEDALDSFNLKDWILAIKSMDDKEEEENIKDEKDATNANHQPKNLKNQKKNSNLVNSTENGNDDEPVTNIFDLESEPTTKANMPVIRDFNFVWSGKTPKQLCQDTCAKAYKTTPRYSDTSQPGGWKSKVSLCLKSETFEFESETCKTQREAEHFAATMLLYHLKKGTSFHSLLPPCFRQVWFEMETPKKTDENEETNKRIQFLRERIAKPMPRSSCTNFLGVNPVALSSDNIISVQGKSNQDWKMEWIRQAEKNAYKNEFELPVQKSKNIILQQIKKHRVVLISGATGSGKSTQVPKMIMEDSILSIKGQETRIICTQPRRISAISLAERVSEELGDQLGNWVGYQVRLESVSSKQTRLLFCTTGILLRILDSDPLLSTVSHVVVDEVHERTLDSDFLLMILKSILLNNSKLKVVLMSATLEQDKLSSYFDHCPVIEIPGRLCPIAVFHLEDVIEKTGFLVEGGDVSRSRVKLKYSGRGGSTVTKTLDWEDYQENEHVSYLMDILETDDSNVQTYSKQTLKTLNMIDEKSGYFDLLETLLEWISFKDVNPLDGSILVFLPGWGEINAMLERINANTLFKGSWVFPLHSAMTAKEQSRAFKIPPNGVIKIVLSTNIAETGVTIPDVTVVIDTGKCREVVYTKGVKRLEQVYIAKANAEQRKGRAGRVKPGKCYRLYSMYRFEKMRDYQKCEMSRLPLQEICLRIKSLSSHTKIEDFLEQALDPPSNAQLKVAIKDLLDVGALDEKENLTKLGSILFSLPTDIRLGKLIVNGKLFGCLDECLSIAACLSHTKSIFVNKGSNSKAHSAFVKHESEFLSMLLAYQTWRSWVVKDRGDVFNLCNKNGLANNELLAVEELKFQLYQHLVHLNWIEKKEKIKFKNIQLCPWSVGDLNVSLVQSVLGLSFYPNLVFKGPIGYLWQDILVEPHSSNHYSSFSRGTIYFTFYQAMKTSKLFLYDMSSINPLFAVLGASNYQIRPLRRLMRVDQINLECNCYVSCLVRQLNKIFRKDYDESLKSAVKLKEWMHLMQQPFML